MHFPIEVNTYSTSETLYQRVRRQSAQRVRRRKGARRVLQRRPGACNCVGDAPAHAPHGPADGRQPFRSAPRRAIAARRLSIRASRAGWRRGRHGALLTQRCTPRRRGDAHSGVPLPRCLRETPTRSQRGKRTPTAGPQPHAAQRGSRTTLAATPTDFIKEETLRKIRNAGAGSQGREI